MLTPNEQVKKTMFQAWRSDEEKLLTREVKGKPPHHHNHQLPTVTNLRAPPNSTAAPQLLRRIISNQNLLPHP
ncbi:hypothetical protein JHK82_031545 [Glycine max]|nr:hypothetical protein JHK85_032199 [Glycine max]KAG4994806.1 hypothetical protein JHK86_031633 [Glycine max]KAG5124808.1 hypothetical protein JHK82_031545 [Glycine max]KAG5146228.1 hypothetical protein JHK84_031771 [Glycine max]